MTHLTSRSTTLVAVLGFAALTAVCSHAQTFTISKLLVTDTTPGSLGDPINDLEVDDNGLFWTVPEVAGGAEFGQFAGIGWLGSRNPLWRSRLNYVLKSANDPLSFAARDASTFYYTGADGLHQRSANALPDDPDSLIGPGWSADLPGALMKYGGRVYCAVGASHALNGPFGGSAWFYVQYVTPPGDTTTAPVPVAQLPKGASYPADPGRIVKMAVMWYQLPGVSTLSPIGVCLSKSGQLFTFQLEAPFTPLFSSLSPLAANISDFAIRRESVANKLGLGSPQDFLYATVGKANCAGDAPGSVIAISNPISGQATTVWTAPAATRLTAIAVDENYLFVSSFPVTAGGGPFGGCQTSGAGVIRGKLRPADPFFHGPTLPDAAWNPIETAAGTNLRSDGQNLYFTYGHQIRVMPTTSSRILLDIAAIGIEAVQVVQDFNNSVPLVAGKEVLVRGYAAVLTNTANLSTLPVTAALHVLQDGVEVAGSPLAAENYPTIDTRQDLPTLRTNLNRAFQFHLPAEWLRPGQLTLHMDVNPRQTLPESLASLGNNRASATFAVVGRKRPTLIFKTMSSTFPNYDPMAAGSGFDAILDRALSLLPVPGFNVSIESGSVTKPTLTWRGVVGRSFDMPDDKTWALIWMAVDHLFASDSDPDTHYIGMLPPAVTGFNGIGGARGVKLSDLMDNPPTDLNLPSTVLDSTAVVRMSAYQSNSTNVWGTVVGGHALAHELGHNYGRFHIRQPASCGTNDPLRPWQTLPAGIDPCTLGETDLNKTTAPIGYDRISKSLVPPLSSGDLMSYADSDWTSPFTWKALVAAIPSAAAAALAQGNSSLRPMATTQSLQPHDPIFVWQGLIHVDANTATLLPGYRLPKGTLDPAKVQESLAAAAALPANATYRLRLVGDPSAAPLDERPVTLIGAAEGDPGTLLFVQAMPDYPAATRLQLLGGNQVMAEWVASSHSPTLKLGQPGFDAVAGTLSLAWDVAAPDGGPVLFAVQFSPDGGSNWRTLKINDPDTGFVLDTQLLPGGDACVVRVIATDGFNSATAVTTPFALPKHAPVVAISGLVDGQRLAFDAPAEARAFSYDAEDGGIDAAGLAWTAVGPESRTGVGAHFPLAGLSPGAYALSATAADADGNRSTSSLAFEVLPVVVPDAPAPTLNGTGTSVGYVGASVIRLVPGVAEPAARIIHQDGVLYVSVLGLPLSHPDAGPSLVELAFDATAARHAKPGTGDVAFGVDEGGVPIARSGNGSTLAPAPLGFGFHAVVARGDTTWNAELAIPDNLIGGWNHDVGLALFFADTQSPLGPTELHLRPAAANLDSPATWAAATLGASPTVPANRPPVAVANGPSVVTVTEDLMVGLDGAGSRDPDGRPLTYAWTQTDGPAVTLQGADTTAPSFAPTVPAGPTAVRFQLVVSDGQTNSAPANVSVLLVPVAPPAPVSDTAAASVSIDLTKGVATVNIGWTGPASAMVTVQASTNLVDWVDLATNAVGYLQVVAMRDAAAGQIPWRFYRAKQWIAPASPAPGDALLLDGVTGLATVPHAAALNALPLTVMAWINTTQATGAYPAIVTKYEGGRARGYAMALDAGRFDAWYYADPNNHVVELTGTQLDGRFVADGQWHHLAYAVGLASARTYIDGVLMDTLTWVGVPGPVTTTQALEFGAYQGGSGLPFAGELDEVSLWNVELSGDQVRALMNQRLAGTETGLLGVWHFDEGAGTVLIDATGQGHDGVLSGAATWQPSTAPVLP